MEVFIFSKVRANLSQIIHHVCKKQQPIPSLQQRVEFQDRIALIAMTKANEIFNIDQDRISIPDTRWQHE